MACKAFVIDPAPGVGSLLQGGGGSNKVKIIQNPLFCRFLICNQIWLCIVILTGSLLSLVSDAVLAAKLRWNLSAPC